MDEVPGWSRAAARRAAAAVGREQGADYEDRAVHRVLDRLGCGAHYPAVAREAAGRTGRPGATFRIADELLGLPVAFGTDGALRVEWLAVPDLFDRFATLPMVEGLEHLIEGLDPDDPRPAAFLFRWSASATTPTGRRAGLKGGSFMAIHTVEGGEPSRAVRVGRRLALGGQDRVVTLEKLDALLESLAGWRPPLA